VPELDTLTLTPVPFDHPDAAALIAAVQREYVHRYGGPDTTPHAPAEFAPPHGYFLVGYAGRVPVACGGWRLRSARPDDPALRDGDAEIKRMYVADGHRGRGHARRLLAALEAAAVAAGARRMILESGDKQPEALELYRSSGYTGMAGFGAYRGNPDSRYLSKPLG
jgi:GNAT superfamily N-acetyltransferase